MTEPNISMPGASDLSRLAQPPARPATDGTAAGASAAPVVALTEANAGAVIQQSTQVPVIVCLWAEASPASIELRQTFTDLAAEYGGRFALATADIQAEPAIAQAFQAQAVPAAVALIAGQPAPLFQGSATAEQLRSVIDQVLEIASQNGVTGTAQGVGSPQAPSDASESEPEPLPPLHQAAYDAIESGDLAAAAAAYEQALRENPRDADARAGLAQVGLMSRTQDADLQAARKAAADAPEDIAAQLAVADLDVLGGKVSDAFDRLIELIARVAPEDRERIRERLVDLFEVAGTDDPRVAEARRKLAAALF